MDSATVVYNQPVTEYVSGQIAEMRRSPDSDERCIGDYLQQMMDGGGVGAVLGALRALRSISDGLVQNLKQRISQSVIVPASKGDGLWVYKGLNMEPATDVEVLQEKPCGEFVVQVFKHHAGDLCYRVVAQSHVGLMRLRCFTDQEERKFPKSAAKLGTEMVDTLTGRNAQCLLISQ